MLLDKTLGNSKFGKDFQRCQSFIAFQDINENISYFYVFLVALLVDRTITGSITSQPRYDIP